MAAVQSLHLLSPQEFGDQQLDISWAEEKQDGTNFQEKVKQRLATVQTTQ